MEYISIIYNLIIYLFVVHLRKTVAAPCKRHMSDIIFMLDSSFSINKVQFGQQLKFVANVVDHFDIGKEQVGILAFNHDVRVELYLNAFDDKEKLKEAIVHIPYEGGGSDIGEVIRYGRTEMFSTKHGGRKDAKKIMVVITDGESDNQTKTDSESRLAKLSGIHLISVGVGYFPNDKELRVIASEPTSVFKVEDFDSLDTIVDSLSEQTCNDENYISPIISTLAQDDQAPPAKECKERLVDVFFVIDNSNSIWAENFKKVLSFIVQIISNFQLSPTKTRVGIISYSDTVQEMLPLQNQMTIKELSETIMNLKQLTGGTETGKAIRYLKSYGFGDGRPDAARIALVFTDGKSKHPKETKQAATDAKKQGIHLISIGIEEESDMQELKEIASEPKEKFTFHVKDYNALDSIKEKLVKNTCEVQADKTKPTDNNVCQFEVPTDVTFIYDSSTVGLYRSKIIRKSIASVIKTINYNNVKVSVLSKTCSKQRNIHFSDYKLKSEFIKSLQAKTSDGLTHLIRKFRIKHKKERHTSKGHKSVVVLFIDDNLTFPETAWKEVNRTAFRSDIYVMSISESIRKYQAERLSSIPPSQYLFHSQSYQELPYHVLDMFKTICS